MPGFLTSLEDIRRVEWRKDYLWDIKFPEAPSPFNDWFPASDIELQLSSINTYQFDGPFVGYKIPHNASPLSLRVSFYDNMEQVLLEWLADWIREIVNIDEGYVLPLSQCCKTVTIMRLDSKRQSIGSATYLVMPDTGTVSFHGGSEATSQTTSYDFYIARKITKEDEGGDELPDMENEPDEDETMIDAEEAAREETEALDNEFSWQNF